MKEFDVDCFLRSSWELDSIGSGDGMVLSMQLAYRWTNLRIWEEINCVIMTPYCSFLKIDYFPITLHYICLAVTDDEIRHGILYDADRERQICFVRNITDLMDNLDHPDAPKFIDMSDREKRIIDTEAQGLLRVLKDDRLSNWVSPDNIHHLQVKWSQSNGIDLYENQEYIIELCENFYSSVCDQIAERVSQQSLLGEDPLSSEVLQHAAMARKLIGIFQGREAILEEVKGYLMEKQDHPLVIHGESGSGKTSLMAMIAGSVPQWMNAQHPVVILRFLGEWTHMEDADSKVHGANVAPTWGRQDPGGPHVCHVNFAICGEVVRT